MRSIRKVRYISDDVKNERKQKGLLRMIKRKLTCVLLTVCLVAFSSCSKNKSEDAVSSAESTTVKTEDITESKENDETVETGSDASTENLVINSSVEESVIDNNEAETSIETTESVRDDSEVLEAWSKRVSSDIVESQIDLDMVKIKPLSDTVTIVEVSDSLPKLKASVDSVFDFVETENGPIYSTIYRFDGRVLSFAVEKTKKLECYNFLLDGTLLSLEDIIVDDLAFDEYVIPDSLAYFYRTDSQKDNFSQNYKELPWVLSCDSIIFFTDFQQVIDNEFFVPYKDFADMMNLNILPGNGDIFGQCCYGSSEFDNTESWEISNSDHMSKSIVFENGYDVHDSLIEKGYLDESESCRSSYVLCRLAGETYLYIAQIAEYDGEKSSHILLNINDSVSEVSFKPELLQIKDFDSFISESDLTK